MQQWRQQWLKEVERAACASSKKSAVLQQDVDVSLPQPATEADREGANTYTRFLHIQHEIEREAQLALHQNVCWSQLGVGDDFGTQQQQQQQQQQEAFQQQQEAWQEQH